MQALRLRYDQAEEEVVMVGDVDKDIQIHIHEHVGPIRERVGRIEGRLEVSEREISNLRQSIITLQEKVDQTKDEILEVFRLHETGEWKRYDEIHTGVQNIRNWLLGIAGGGAAVWVVLQFLISSGLFVHG